jgi:hypothetical protein
VASILVLIASMGRRLTPEAKAAEVEAAPVATVRRSLLIGGVLMVVGLGVFPQLLFPWVIRAAQGLHNLIP